jgi:hypothetical protein
MGTATAAIPISAQMQLRLIALKQSYFFDSVPDSAL